MNMTHFLKRMDDQMQKAEAVLPAPLPFLNDEGHVSALFNTWMLSDTLTNTRWKVLH